MSTVKGSTTVRRQILNDMIAFYQEHHRWPTLEEHDTEDCLPMSTDVQATFESMSVARLHANRLRLSRKSGADARPTPPIPTIPSPAVPPQESPPSAPPTQAQPDAQ